EAYVMPFGRQGISSRQGN
ncbi:hypothetical protein Pmar_PMAR017337, partial [Perkinsus marinus ATCC 50983]